MATPTRGVPVGGGSQGYTNPYDPQAGQDPNARPTGATLQTPTELVKGNLTPKEQEYYNDAVSRGLTPDQAYGKVWSTRLYNQGTKFSQSKPISSSPSDQISNVENQQDQFYNYGRKQSLGYWDAANKTANDYAANQPNYVQNLYKQTQSQYTDPGMFEKFAQGAMTGDNPTYDYLKSQAIKDSNRQSAARGGFLSGRAMKSQGDMLANLAAQEYSTRSGIAKDAEAAQQDRLSHGMDAAGKASGEVNDYFKNLSGMRTDVAKGQSDTQSTYDKLQGDTHLQLEVARINKQLAEGALSKEQANNKIKNAIAGAGAGATVGTAILPGWGTAAGAVGGGLLGLLGS